MGNSMNLLQITVKINVNFFCIASKDHYNSVVAGKTRLAVDTTMAIIHIEQMNVKMRAV